MPKNKGISGYSAMRACIDDLVGKLNFFFFVGKGGKNRRRGRNENESMKRELIFKEEGQEYAQVIKMLGNGRLEAFCFDGISRLAHIRGKLRKKACNEAGFTESYCFSMRYFLDSLLKFSLPVCRSGLHKVILSCLDFVNIKMPKQT